MKYLLVLLLSFLPLTASAATVPVALGGTGATTFSIGQCLKGNGTSAITTGICGGGAGGTWSTSTSQVAGRLVNYPNNTTDIVVIGATATTSANYYIDPNINFALLKFASTTAVTATSFCFTLDVCRTTWPTSSGGGSGNVSTSSAETAGSLAYWTSNSATPALLGKVATTAIAVTAPITFSGTLGAQVGGAAGNFGCTSASLGVTGCMTAIDWGLLHTATTTFSSPLVYTGSTNAVTCPTCGTGTSNFGATSTNPFMASYFVATSTTATSTGANGWNLTSGCFAVNNTCVGSGGAALSGGVNGMMAAWSSSSNIIPTSTPIAAAYIATSTTATSTFAGNLLVGTGATFPLLQVGSTTCQSPVIQGVFMQACGNDSSDFGVTLGLQNKHPLGFNGIFFNNDIIDTPATKYAFIGLNGSQYVNTDFGTGVAASSSLIFTNTIGDIRIMATNVVGPTSNSNILFFTGGSSTANETMRMLAGGYITMGTTTPKLGVLTIGTSTAPQLVLSDNNPASNLWTMRSINNTLFIATSTATATSSVPAIQIQSGRGLAVGTTTSVGIVNLGFNAGSSASSTIIMEKLQFQGKDAAGNMRCAFLDVSGNFAVGASGVACTN